MITDDEMAKLTAYRDGKSPATQLMVDRYIEMANAGLAVHRWVDGELQVMATDAGRAAAYARGIKPPTTN